MANGIVSEIVETIERLPKEDQERMLRIAKAAAERANPENLQRVQEVLTAFNAAYPTKDADMLEAFLQLDDKGREFVSVATQSALSTQRRREELLASGVDPNEVYSVMERERLSLLHTVRNIA